MARQHSPAVYRRRRLVVFGALILAIVVLIVALWAVIARPWASEADEKTDSPTAQSSAQPSQGETEDPEGDATQAPAPSAEPTAPAESVAPEEPAEVTACTADQVEVGAITDAESYAAEAMPLLSISLTNTSDVDCIIDVGTSTQKFTITSGSDVWWRSTDCQAEPNSLEVTLAAKQTTTTTTPLEWDRTRSSVDTCDQEGRPQAPGGGASYNLAVSIGGFDSVASKRFFLH